MGQGTCPCVPFETGIMISEMGVLEVRAKKKSRNFLKVRVGHGTCPRVPDSFFLAGRAH